MGQQSTPQHASHEALAAYALRRVDRGEDADDLEAQHIRQCVECLAGVSWIEAQVRQMEEQLYRLECPSVEQLTDYAMGELGAPDKATIAAHARSCARCADEVAMAQEALAPSSVLRSPIAQLRRVLATLMPPAALLDPALNRRARPDSNEPDTLRTFAADGIEVTLRSETEQSLFLLYGTISQTESDLETSNISVRLLRTAEPDSGAEPAVMATAPVELDAFELGPVPAGTYQLEVVLPDRVIVIPSLAI